MRKARLALFVGMAGCVVAGFSTTSQAETWKPGPPVKTEVSADGVQRATIILDSYSYTPNHLVVEAGKLVELTLTSITTLTPHNFVLNDSAGGVSVEQDVGAGKSVTVRFTPNQHGSIPFFCDKRLWPMPSHRDKGMEGLLEVN